MRWFKYLGSAFNARPLGMPVPPLWFAVIVSALLGAFISPALMLIGLGATGLTTAIIASNARFQLVVDARAYQPAPVADNKTSLLARLDIPSRERQAKLETQCTALQQVLENANAGQEQWGQACRGSDYALGAHASLSQAQVQCVVAAGGEARVYIRFRQRTACRQA